MSDGTGSAQRYEQDFAAVGSERTHRVSPSTWKDGAQALAADKFPAWLFVADGVRLYTANPVQIVVERSGPTYYAECQRLHVIAQGATRGEATDDLNNQVVYFYERYSKMGPDEVTGLAAELREIYSNRFQKLQAG
jgi:hypothetical protein